MRIILSVILILVLLYLFNYFVRHNIKFYSKSESNLILCLTK